MNPPPLTLFYDGLCPLCSREIAYYRRRVRDGLVRFIDIADPAFDAPAHGLDPERVHRVMHAKVGDRVRTGLDVFIALWERVPRFRLAARLARLPVLNELLTGGYHLFALVRPWLPRRKAADCAGGTCAR